MTSFLAGSLAKTIGKALASTFLPATLTRGSSVYSCSAIFENYGQFPGAGGALSTPDAKILVLASTLAVSPVDGDVISIPTAPFASGLSFVVFSLKDSVDAVSIDPAGAVWTLVTKAVSSSSGAASLQNAEYSTYAALATALGFPYSLYRSTGSNPIASGNLVETLKAIFTDGKSQGFNFNRAATYDDALQNALLDASQVQPGDYLVGARTYFVASMEPLRPVNVIECNRTISLSRSLTETGANGQNTPVRQPSQTGGSSPYFGRQVDPAGSTSSTENQVIATGIPVLMVANAGRATGQVETPSGAPGPSRWRIYLPISIFPKGSVLDRDYLTDEEGNRHMVSAAAWTNLGYRLEAIREEF